MAAAGPPWHASGAVLVRAFCCTPFDWSIQSGVAFGSGLPAFVALSSAAEIPAPVWTHGAAGALHIQDPSGSASYSGPGGARKRFLQSVWKRLNDMKAMFSGLHPVSNLSEKVLFQIVASQQHLPLVLATLQLIVLPLPPEQTSLFFCLHLLQTLLLTDQPLLFLPLWS